MFRKGDTVPMGTYIESLYVQILTGNIKEVYSKSLDKYMFTRIQDPMNA